MLIANTLAVGTSLSLLAVTHSLWTTVAVAALLGFMSGQLGFQLHDSGHRQMFSSRRLNMVIGVLTGNGLLGMSYGWWVDKHNRHHGNPNHQDLDPDIGVGVIAYSEEQALAATGVSRWVVRNQARLFFLLLFGLAWSMHVASVRFLIRTKDRFRWIEVGALCLHVLAYVGLLVAIVGPWRALLVIVVQKSVGGFYMAAVFAPNHKGMPQIESGQELDFLRSQVLTSRNVKSSRVTDLLWIAQLSDRAPSVPNNAAVQHPSRSQSGACVLRRARCLLSRNHDLSLVSRDLELPARGRRSAQASFFRLIVSSSAAPRRSTRTGRSRKRGRSPASGPGPGSSWRSGWAVESRVR